MHFSCTKEEMLNGFLENVHNLQLCLAKISRQHCRWFRETKTQIAYQFFYVINIFTLANLFVFLVKMRRAKQMLNSSLATWKIDNGDG